VLTVEEIVWKGEVVGKIGGIGMRKTARPPAGSERR